MRHLKTYEGVYNWTMDEVKSILGIESTMRPKNIMIFTSEIISNATPTQLSLIYNIGKYLEWIKKAPVKLTSISNILNANNPTELDILLIDYQLGNVNKWNYIENEERFLSFLNDPELFIATNKYNL